MRRKGEFTTQRALKASACAARAYLESGCGPQVHSAAGVGARAQATRQRLLRAHHKDPGRDNAQGWGSYNGTGHGGHRLRSACVHRQTQRPTGALRGGARARRRHANVRCAPTKRIQGKLLRRSRVHIIQKAPVSRDIAIAEVVACSSVACCRGEGEVGGGGARSCRARRWARRWGARKKKYGVHGGAR